MQMCVYMYIFKHSIQYFPIESYKSKTIPGCIVQLPWLMTQPRIPFGWHNSD